MFGVDEGIEGVGGEGLLEGEDEVLDAGLDGGVGCVGGGGDEGGGDVWVLGWDD